MSTDKNPDIVDRSIALSGLFQAARLVQLTSQGQHRDTRATTTSLSSLFNTDPDTAAGVYGSAADLAIGLEVLLQQLGNDNKKRNMELTGYAITLMHLEKKMSRQTGLLNKLSAGIERINSQIEFFDESHVTVIAALAELYKETISTLQPRIIVKGEESILGNINCKNMIRALLLAGIRAAVLWRQCGGTRVKLIFQRKSMLACCNELLRQARHEV